MTERDEEISTAMPKDLDALPRRGGFRLRGLEMTRLESFVDATFAFAVSLLVIAGQQADRFAFAEATAKTHCFYAATSRNAARKVSISDFFPMVKRM